MIGQNVKDAYYFVLSPMSRVLKPLYSLHYRLFRKRFTKVQVGCGEKYLPNFINIDGNFRRKADYILDVRCGLPFPDNSIELIYSCHMLEHVHVAEAIRILKEWRRVLSHTGYIRLTLPDFEHIFRIIAGEEDSSFPRRFQSLHGKAINFLFCDGQHKFAYSRAVVEELALGVGFSRVVPAKQMDTNVSDGNLMEPPGSFSVNIFR